MKFGGGHGGGSGNGEGYGLILMGAVILVTLSLFINFCYPNIETQNDVLEELNGQYLDFTGSSPSSESVWTLTGVFSAYGTDASGNAYDGFGHTPDGWLYGARIVNYSPTQYNTDPTAYSATYDEQENVYKYAQTSTTYNKHNQGDLYGSVVMDVGKKSDIFFSSSGKVTEGDLFYYAFTGWRYVWQPVDSYVTKNHDGQEITVVPNTSSLSLIWYDYYGGEGGPGTSGLAGQLIIVSDYGTAYLTSAEIISAFNTDTSTSKFVMTFNGVDMNVYIKLDPSKLSAGLTVGECYEYGYWSVMVSSVSVNADSVLSSDYEFNPYNIFMTMIKLLTFNVGDYGLTGLSAALASFVIVIPLLVGIMVLGLNNYIVLILAGIYGVLSAFSWGLF